MFKKLFILIPCAFAFNAAMAQEPAVTNVTYDDVTYVTNETVEYSADKYKVETNRFWSNWFISVAGGAQIYFGDHDNRADFGDRLAPTLDASVGKWFTPGIGVRIMYSGLQVKGATKHPDDSKYDSAHGTGEDVDGGSSPHFLERSKFNMANFHIDALFNLTNLFCGYKEKRFYNFTFYGGLGLACCWDEPTKYDVSANVGILNTFRLCDALDLNFEVRGMFVNDEFDGEEGGRWGEGLLSASIGLTYKFKKRGWDRSKTITRYTEADLSGIREKMNALDAENARLKDALANKKSDTKWLATPNIVVFEINKSELTNHSRVTLGMMAEVIKKGSPDAVYNITGYADAGTGTPEINERLSRERAEAVYDCLTNEFNVPSSQLRVDYKGGVENMFYDDPCLSRAVITKAE